MKQPSLGLGGTAKGTRRREFLDEMEKVVPWADLVALVSPYLPEGKRGRPPFSPETMLRIHFMQQWFALSDPAMEEALHDMPVFREFAGLEGWDERLPDESTILRFRHVLEKHKLAAQILQTVNDLLSAKGVMLKSGTVVDATLIAAPSSTKNSSGERDPEMKQSRKGQQWYFGMKCHIGVEVESGLGYTVKGTGGSVNDVIEANGLVRSGDSEVFADAGYQGAGIRPDARDDVRWNIAVRSGKRRMLDLAKPIEALTEKLERVKAGIRARVEHPFRVVKCQFGHIKVRHCGPAKNTSQLHTLSALANLWLMRRKLMGA
ncbi:IS5 family transposase [Ideonella sp. 4Y16]|uniref:IS5 family transposase n=1 Tax=Ideonella alba TaxID=2824118 RepID=UPI001B381380|nr:IS5 family transposase [Ideonella alba]MBQ0942214.1 IS5 family transposase [Ideonella alba]